MIGRQKLAVCAMALCMLPGMSGAQGRESTVVSAPAPGGAAMSTDYTIKVNGKPVAVYAAPVWYPGYVKPFGGPYSFASFDFAGTADVEIATSKSLQHVVVRPESRGVRPAVSGQTLTFTLARPCQLSIEPDGKNGPLLLFANPLERDVPKPSDPRVRYFGPGVHKVGKIELGDDETLYIAAGAVVQGGVHATGRNIRIRGRGILDGGLWERWKGPGRYLLDLDRCSNVSVEGIILKDSWGWVLVADSSRDVSIENVKTCSARCENNDGIDIVNTSRLTMRNCFIRSDDDCIAPKGLGEWHGAEPYPPVEDITVEHCVLWTDRAHVWRMGCESRAAAMRRMIFRDIDVLHYTDPTCPVISVQPAEDMLMEEVRFQDIRINHEGQTKFLELDPHPTPWAKKQTPGLIQSVVFRDIILSGSDGAAPATVVINGADGAHPISGVVFQSVLRHGKKVQRDSPGVTITGSTRDIQFR